MTKYKIWARVVVGVGFSPIEADGPARAIQKLTSAWPHKALARLIDKHFTSGTYDTGATFGGPGGINALQYDEGSAPIEFMIDLVNSSGENEDDYTSTTFWALDPDNDKPYLVKPSSREEKDGSDKSGERSSGSDKG